MDNVINKSHNIISKFPIIGKYITKQFMRFFIIGFSSFLIFYVIDNILIFILTYFLNPNELMRSIIVSFSYLIAFIISFIFNFTFSKKWTFRSKSSNYKKQITKFLVVNILNAILGAVITTFLDYLGIPPTISLIPITAIQMLWSYFVYKTLVFKD